ncbi:MAG: cytochrome P450 [Rhodobacteraceae bacterium]|nr:cytochrome P450 [Paracoccaceae bacterium]
MSNAPVFNIDVADFIANPYPMLKQMRAEAPIAFVPQLNATLLTKRDAIFDCEKNIAVFSSEQPGGLMDVLMGQNMMRLDGAPHQEQRRAVFPTLSPRTVRDQWQQQFHDAAEGVLSELAPRGRGDLVKEFSLLLSAEALKIVTGLTNMDAREVDRVSQGMIDGIANYTGDPTIEANCHNCTATIDSHITARIPELLNTPDTSLLSIQMQAGLPETATRANIKLAISGGQNEPRDAIAGVIWALLRHPDQLALVQNSNYKWRDAFEEYARWISPIGMSPRRIAKRAKFGGVTFEPEERIFFMFSSANHDEDIFQDPETYDLTRDNAPAIAFGAGPHFCAGAGVARALISEVALPMAFERLPNLRLAPNATPTCTGWAFRGLTSLDCEWDS